MNRSVDGVQRVSLGLALVLALAVAGCGKKAPAKHDATTPQVGSAAPGQEAAAVPVPAEEPPEAVLQKLEFEAYERIERLGGIPVTVTATGQHLVLRPKLYAVRKKGPCRPDPGMPKGWYECTLTIKLSINGGEPDEQGERIGVKWDPRGMWVSQ